MGLRRLNWMRPALLVILAVIVMVIYQFIITKGDSSARYKIIQIRGDYYQIYYTDRYEVTENGCVKFDDIILCGTYSIEKND